MSVCNLFITESKNFWNIKIFKKIIQILKKSYVFVMKKNLINILPVLY